jgi:hypothetical protein
MFGKLHHLSQDLFSSKVYVQADQFKLKRQVSVDSLLTAMLQLVFCEHDPNWS